MVVTCYNPVWIDDPDYPGNKIKVPCCKCPVCQVSRRKSWFYRLKVESDHSVCSYCVTLTYNDDVVPDYQDYQDQFRYHPLQYEDIQKFNKRLRKRLGKFRFFCVCEFGSERLRPHYHILYFFAFKLDRTTFDDAVFSLWYKNCRITIDETTERAANYILKYCLSPVGEDVPDEFRPEIHCSTKPFIGYQLLLNPEVVNYFKSKITDISSYCGYRQRLPRIYRDRIFEYDPDLLKIIKYEMGDMLQDYHNKIQADRYKYIDKYSQDPMQWQQDAFNKKISRLIKLKSLK